MVKPFLSLITRPTNKLNQIIVGLIELDQELEGSDFSYEIIVPVVKPEVRAELKKFVTLLANVKIVAPPGDEFARGSWRLFAPINYPNLLTDFMNISTKSRPDDVVTIGVRSHRRPISNFLIRWLLKSKLADHFTCFRCFGHKTYAKIASKIKSGWHCELDPLIIVKEINVPVVTFSSLGTACTSGPMNVLQSILRLRRQIKTGRILPENE